MGAIQWIFIGVISFVIIKSIIVFLSSDKIDSKMQDKRFSIDVFYTLLVTYSIIIIGFGLIYFIISFHHINLVEAGEMRQVGIIGSMIHSFYFSGVTLLTIGYGDITPLGISRLIAIIEALIGYALPTAFVLRIAINARNRGQE